MQIRTNPVSLCAILILRPHARGTLGTNLAPATLLGYMYICGGSNTVVDGVGDTLSQLLVAHCGVSLDAARNIKVEWKESRRLCVEHFAG